MDDVTFSINQLIFSIIQLANSKDLKLTIMTHSLYNSTLIKLCLYPSAKSFNFIIGATFKQVV